MINILLYLLNSELQTRNKFEQNHAILAFTEFPDHCSHQTFLLSILTL